MEFELRDWETFSRLVRTSIVPNAGCLAQAKVLISKFHFFLWEQPSHFEAEDIEQSSIPLSEIERVLGRRYPGAVSLHHRRLSNSFFLGVKDNDSLLKDALELDTTGELLSGLITEGTDWHRTNNIIMTYLSKNLNAQFSCAGNARSLTAMDVISNLVKRGFCITEEGARNVLHRCSTADFCETYQSIVRNSRGLNLDVVIGGLVRYAVQNGQFMILEQMSKTVPNFPRHFEKALLETWGLGKTSLHYVKSGSHNFDGLLIDTDGWLFRKPISSDVAEVRN